MTADNSQDDVSIAGELTETRLEVSAKSRLVSAIDRLGGDVVDAIGSPINGWNERRKARIAGEKLLIEAAAKFGVEQLSKGGEFAARVFSNQFGKLAREQANKDAVLEAAIEDLRSPRQEEEHDTKKEKLDDTFLDRFDTYASQATTEALREKWGRVLAAEVRKPGTFSNKVLRVIDELEADTALLFEKVCANRLRDVLPKCLIGKLQFVDVAALSTAGLILEPGVGQVARFANQTLSDGSPLWLLGLGERALSLPSDVTLSSVQPTEEPAVSWEAGAPAIPVYILTDEGLAICAILPDRQDEAFGALATKLREAIPHGRISTFSAVGGRYKMDGSIPERDQGAALT